MRSFRKGPESSDRSRLLTAAPPLTDLEGHNLEPGLRHTLGRFDPGRGQSRVPPRVNRVRVLQKGAFGVEREIEQALGGGVEPSRKLIGNPVVYNAKYPPFAARHVEFRLVHARGHVDDREWVRLVNGLLRWVVD